MKIFKARPSCSLFVDFPKYLLYRRLRLACSLFFQNGFLKEHMNKISTYTKKVNPCNQHLKIRKHNRKEKYKEIMFNQIFFFLKRKNQIITKH